jgi:hypothetical protein
MEKPGEQNRRIGDIVVLMVILVSAVLIIVNTVANLIG